MLPLGTVAPVFKLKDHTLKKTVRLENYPDARAYLVVFMCNHCPYVIHLLDPLIALAREVKPDVAVFGINSNDTKAYPQDSISKMAELVGEKQLPFPYLIDETQEIATAYRAACTPDFFLFNRSMRLAYRGQFDDSRPGNGIPCTGQDLRLAIDNVLNGRPCPPEDQKPSMGCNIKWKPGNAPAYFR